MISAAPQTDLYQPHGIGRIARADHEQQLTAVGQLLHSVLPVGRGVTDVVLVRRGDARKASLQHRDDIGGVVHRQGGLGHEGDVGDIHRLKRLGVLDMLDQANHAVGQLAHGSDHFRVTGVADQHDLAAGVEMALGLHMDLRHQRAGGVEEQHLPRLRLGRHRLGHPVGGEHHGPVGRRLVQLFNKDRAQGLQPVDHVAVVDDFVPHIDRRAVFLDRPLDDLDRSVNTRAEPARAGQQDLERRLEGRSVIHGGKLGADEPSRQRNARQRSDCAAQFTRRPVPGSRDG